MARKSNLELVNECDDFPYYSTSPEVFAKTLAEFHVLKVHGCEATLGYVPNEIAGRLPSSELWTFETEKEGRILRLFPSGPLSNEDRTEAFARYLQTVREKGGFQVLSGWRAELYPVYGPGKELLFSMERSATPLFGVVQYGVHMTGYVMTKEGMKIWAPRRAETKQTYPGMMDNTVAGGLGTGEKPFGGLIREALEEASLPEEIARTAKACGTLTYFHLRDELAGGESGLCQPECQYVYDLELPENVMPKPNDNEAVDFRLLSVAEVQEAMAEGQFKPNCALLLLEFFVRHGILIPETEPDYIEIVARLHRRLEFPTV